MSGHDHTWLHAASARGEHFASAHVCSSCGLFRVFIDGIEFHFWLATDALVRAAGAYRANVIQPIVNEMVQSKDEEES